MRQASSFLPDGAASEGMYRVPLGGPAHPADQGLAIRDLDLAGEQAFDEADDADIFEHADRRRRFDVHHDVDVAVRPRLIASHRSEQGRMHHPEPAQRRLIGAQGGDDSVVDHGRISSAGRSGWRGAAIGGKIIAPETVRALLKDVNSKRYGGNTIRRKLPLRSEAQQGESPEPPSSGSRAASAPLKMSKTCVDRP